MIQSVRGMNDVLPPETIYWQFLEQTLVRIVQSYGYQEIKLPIVESTNLFKRAIGEVTDIVEKEMYTFEDRNGDSLTLRPEGTAGGVRSALQNGLIHNQTQRLWYLGPMFRHERPQKGRYRQFYHLGAETFGFASSDIELELLLINARFWQALGIKEKINLHINTLGTFEDRLLYKAKLVEYLTPFKHLLDEDSQRRLTTNPLRILDSKNPEVQQVVKNAPKLLDVMCHESRQHFEKFCSKVDKAGINFTINPKLVRGLDYYSHIVFEWITDELGAQGTVCAGGRYDDLIIHLGGKETPAAGFAIGIERLLMLMMLNVELTATIRTSPHIYMIAVGEQATAEAFLLAENLRSQFAQLIIINNASEGSFKSQFKRADKSGAEIALIIGEEELANKSIGIKCLREEVEQKNISQSELSGWLTQYYKL